MPDFTELLGQNWVIPLVGVIIAGVVGILGLPNALNQLHQFRHRNDPTPPLPVSRPPAQIPAIQQSAPVPVPDKSAENPTLLGLSREGSAHFVGRVAELEALGTKLLNEPNVRVTASLAGLAGIGKTELAVQLVRKADRDGSFPGGIYWLDAEEADLSGQWAAIGTELRITGPLDEVAAEVIRQLNASTEPTLVVLDNVEQWPVVPAVPACGKVSVLITTRDCHVGGSTFSTTNLGFLDPDDAKELISSVSERSAEETQWDRLLEHLGGHALALELAGAYLRAYPEESPDAYLAALLEGGDVEAKVKDQAAYEATVSHALGRSWKPLSDEMQRAWCIAAQFAPEFVSLPLSDACGVDADGRAELARFHLIEREEGGRWRMHRLTRQFGLQRAKEQDSPSPEVLFLGGCVEVASRMDIHTGLLLYLPDQAHFDAAVASGAEALGPDAYASFLSRVASALESAGSFDRSRELFQRVLVSNLERYGGDHFAVALARNNLAVVLKVMGDLAGARELLEQSLDSALRTFGNDHSYVATARSNLGAVLEEEGDLAGARKLFEQVLASDLDTHDDSRVAQARSNLANLLRRQGELARARDLMKQALSSDLQTYGEDHPLVALRRSNLSGIMVAQKVDLSDARALSEKALASDLKTYGEDHHTVALDLNNLAGVLTDQGDLAGARKLYAEALRIFVVSLGSTHPSTEKCRSILREVEKLIDLRGASLIKRMGRAIWRALRRFWNSRGGESIDGDVP